MRINNMEDEKNIIIYKTDDGKANVVLMAKDGNIWMNQNQLAELFDTSKQNIGQHIKSILEDNELDGISVVKNYFTTASDGKKYEVTFYSLDMILAIGFRVRSKRGTQFRIWANKNLKEYMIKGFVIDDERLKNPDGRPDYFDELTITSYGGLVEGLSKEEFFKGRSMLRNREIMRVFKDLDLVEHLVDPGKLHKTKTAQRILMRHADS